MGHLNNSNGLLVLHVGAFSAVLFGPLLFPLNVSYNMATARKKMGNAWESYRTGGGDTTMLVEGPLSPYQP